MKTTKTWFPKEKEIVQRWRHIDATDQTLGRLADDIAMVLMGKNRPTYTPFALTGDYVVVTNAARIRVTGDKGMKEMYYRHSGYMGNMKQETLDELLHRNPERLLMLAVKGMLPVNTRRAHLMKRLKIYAGDRHPHEAQIKGYPVDAKAPRAPRVKAARVQKVEEPAIAVPVESAAPAENVVPPVPAENAVPAANAAPPAAAESAAPAVTTPPAEHAPAAEKKAEE